MKGLLSVSDLRVALGGRSVVDGLSFEVGAGEAVALVGESGSGKTQTALALMGLSPAGSEVRGTLELDGLPLIPEKIRGRRVAMVFQDPMSSLNPYLTVGEQIAEPLLVHQGLSMSEARERAGDLLERVRIPDPGRGLNLYPHELSGGMRQRAMLAMALSCGPELLIADEPTTALDVTVQAAILELLAELQAEEGLAMLFVGHDLAVVRQVCSRVMVMFHGRIVEAGPIADVFYAPRHHYTRALLDAVPRLDRPMGTEGAGGPDTTRPAAWVHGCAYRSRCPRADEACVGSPPVEDGTEGRRWACVHPLV